MTSEREESGWDWQDYETTDGHRPIHDFLSKLSDRDLACIVAAMKEARREGPQVARYMHEELYLIEASVEGKQRVFKILYTMAYRSKNVLLVLVVVSQRISKRTPYCSRKLARKRLADWRSREIHELASLDNIPST